MIQLKRTFELTKASLSMNCMIPLYKNKYSYDIFYTIDVIAYNYCDHILSNQGRTLVEVSTYNLYAIMLYAIVIIFQYKIQQ